MRGFPPAPATDNWRDWANRLVEYLGDRGQADSEVLPHPVALGHLIDDDHRAIQDGVLMYDPVAGRVVVSVGGVWKEVAWV